MAKKPTEIIKGAVDELCSYNERTKDKSAGGIFLGKDIFVVELVTKRVIEGVHKTIDQTMDILDLIDLHKQERDG